MSHDDKRVFEVRTYHANPGKMEALHKLIREKTIPLFKKHGLTPVGFWVPRDKPNTLVYVLVFDNIEAREKAVGAYFSDPDAKKALDEAQMDGPLLSAPPEMLVSDAPDYSPLI